MIFGVVGVPVCAAAHHLLLQHPDHFAHLTPLPRTPTPPHPEPQQQLLELAKSMKELLDMFQDMAALVELQGEKLQSIEDNMDNAVDYVEKGNKQLAKAVKYQKSKRKQMCCCVIIGLIILAVIITPILLTSLNTA